MASSHYTTFFLLFTLLIASCLQSQARESHFFSKTAPKQQGEDHPLDFTLLSAFKENTSPPSEQPFTSFAGNKNHGLYSHESLPTVDRPYQNTPTVDRPDQNPPTVDFPSFKPLLNEFDQSFTSKDPHSGFSGYGMSDTRVFKNGKYFYDIKNEKYQNGYPYHTGPNGAGFENPTYNGVDRSGSGFGYPYNKGSSEYSFGEDRYGGYGSYGTNGFNGNYETNNYNQEEREPFVP